MAGDEGGVVTPAPSVARVLLVAHPSRQRELEPSLRVEREEVGYAVRFAAPDDVPSEPTADVIVVDGESFLDDRSRLCFLRRVGQRPRRATVLYVCSRLPLESELDYAGVWADDFIYPGWAQPERVRRRVQVVALAPWRRSVALRELAERLGDRKLRVLAGGERSRTDGRRHLASANSAEPRVDLEKADRSEATADVATRAFHEGRRSGAAAVRETAEGLCEELLGELADMRATLTPELTEEIEEAIRESAGSDAVASPLLAARLRGARDAITALQGQLVQLVQSELEDIEPRRAR